MWSSSPRSVARLMMAQSREFTRFPSMMKGPASTITDRPLSIEHMVCPGKVFPVDGASFGFPRGDQLEDGLAATSPLHFREQRSFDGKFHTGIERNEFSERCFHLIVQIYCGRHRTTERHIPSEQGVSGGRWESRSPDLHGVNVALFQLS